MLHCPSPVPCMRAYVHYQHNCRPPYPFVCSSFNFSCTPWARRQMCAKHVRPLVCVSFHFVANPFPVTLCWSSLCLGIDLECSATRRSPRPNAAQPVKPTRKDFEAMDAIGDDLFVPSPNAVPARFLRPELAPAANVAHAIRAFVGATRHYASIKSICGTHSVSASASVLQE